MVLIVDAVHLRDVEAAQIGIAAEIDLRRKDLPAGDYVKDAACAAGSATAFREVGRDENVGNVVARHVVGVHPEPQSIAGVGAENLNDARSRTDEVDHSRKFRLADHDVGHTGLHPIRVVVEPVAVLRPSQDIGNSVTCDVAEGDFSAEKIVRTRSVYRRRSCRRLRHVDDSSGQGRLRSERDVDLAGCPSSP